MFTITNNIAARRNKSGQRFNGLKSQEKDISFPYTLMQLPHKYTHLFGSVFLYKCHSTNNHNSSNDTQSILDLTCLQQMLKYKHQNVNQTKSNTSLPMKILNIAEPNNIKIKGSLNCPKYFINSDSCGQHSS